MRSKLLITPVILILFFLVGCSSSKNKLPKYQYMIINEQEVQNFEAEDIRNFLLNLDTVKHQFHDNPDYVIYAHTSEQNFDMFCIYLDEELIYHGDVFKAMLDDLTNRKSNCFQMDEATLEFMKNLETSY